LVASVRRFDDHLTTNGRFRKHAVHRQRGLPAGTSRRGGRNDRELRRRWFGSIVTGKGGGRTSFGAALYAGANAFRHSEEWAAGGKPFPTTKAVLDVLGVSCDDEACTQILELMTRKGSPYVASFLTLKDFEIEIEIAASQMWDAARKMAPP
jgi:hypothetical protein